MSELRSHGTSHWLVSVLAIVGALAACGENEAPDDDISSIKAPEIARLAAVEEALLGSQVAKLDPASMNDAEVRKGVGTGPVCMFKYTSSGHPVLVVSMQPGEAPRGGVVKLNGSLVELKPIRMNEKTQDGRIVLAADPVRLTVIPDGDNKQWPESGQRNSAEMIFEVGQSLKVGYGGYVFCQPHPPTRSPRK